MSGGGIRAAVEGAALVALPGGKAGDGDSGDGAALDRDLAWRERSDLGNAERLLARRGEDFLWVRDVGWHAWDGRRWARPGAEEALRTAAHETARLVAAEAAALKKQGPAPGMDREDFDARVIELLKWAVASGNRSRIEGMIAEARPYRACAPEDLDADPRLLNLANGTLRLEAACDGLRPHARDDRLAKVLEVEFDAEATAPHFERYLMRVQPRADLRRFLQVWSGYALTGEIGEQKLVFNYGTGANGKSVFTELVARILGPYAATLPFASLIRNDRQRGADATPDLARLPGVRLVRASEPEKGVQLAEATIKAITGGEEITARHLHRDFFAFRPQFKLMLAGNHKPFIRGQDRGIWRRLLLVPWEVSVPDDEQDPDLPAKLWAERSGVLNWLLDGARIWLERGLEIPDAVRAATEDYRADSDPLGRFLEECVRREPGSDIQAAALYDAYKRWCAAAGERPWSAKGFGNALRERDEEFQKVKRGGYVTYLGLRVEGGPAAGGGEEPPPAEPDDFD